MTHTILTPVGRIQFDQETRQIESGGTNMKARVVIVDDHPLFRVGLGYALKALEFDVVAEAQDGADGVRKCLEFKPDAVLLDAKMPNMDGLEACRQIHAGLPNTKIIMLTTFSEPALVQAAKDAGAVGFVSKETEAPKLAKLIEQLIKDPSATQFPRIELPKLTPRELEVLRSMVLGKTNKEIAKELKLSPDTIKDHLENLYRKLEAQDRVTASQRARDLGLV
jgi:two-component system, NarL family, nitrate/nitrite response regulator NarL